MFKALEFCLPTNAAKVPAGPGWLHEIKRDGFNVSAIGNTARMPTQDVRSDSSALMRDGHAGVRASRHPGARLFCAILSQSGRTERWRADTGHEAGPRSGSHAGLRGEGEWGSAQHIFVPHQLVGAAVGKIFIMRTSKDGCGQFPMTPQRRVRAADSAVAF